MRLLLIEAEALAARQMTHVLKTCRAIVEHAESGEDGLDLARHYDYDLVLLDHALPDLDGTEVVRRMRAGGINTPAVVMTAQSQADINVRAFQAGADDVIRKPFDPAELQARLQAIMRRSRGYSQPTLMLGSLQLNLDSREVLVGGTSVRLTGKEYAVLELLVLRKGMVLSKDMFLDHLYGGTGEPDSKIIDLLVSRVRKKLADAGAPDAISTVWGCGHMMREVATPSRVPAPPTALTTKPTAAARKLAAA